MKILSILGSPRSGKISASIANRFTETAESLGAEVQNFELNRLTYRGCQGCYACKKSLDHCILDDGLTPVLNAVHKADVVVLSSPVYFGDITSQLKGFIDRSYSFLTPEYMTGGKTSRLNPKKLVFILSQGYSDKSWFADIFTRYEPFLKWMGFAERRLIRSCGYGPLTIDSAPASVLKEAEDVARELLE